MTGKSRRPGNRTGQRISPHAEWLALVETVEPFLDLDVLDTALPQGCAPVRTALRDRLALAVEELRAEPAKAELFVEFVLREVLEWDLDGDPAYGAAVRDSAIPGALAYRPPSTGETLRPDVVLMAGNSPEVLVARWPAGTPLDKAVPDRSWAASPVDRMVELCRATGNPVGLVTNGWRWAVVHAAEGLPVGVATFDAEIWVDEPVTLAAFADLLGNARWFSRPDDEHLSALLHESGNREEAVTGQLGAQVRAAVEHLVDALSRADRDLDGTVLADVSPREVYRGAVTATMRMVFLLYAEDRHLLPLQGLYAESYAMHTLFDRLRADAARLTEDILERRHSAWGRLLATSRAVHGGARHDALRLPAYGGSLFDPERFPWLARLRVDDRTMLRVLDRLLMLRREGRASIEAMPLSYRSLDVEQIGYVYEGLLDHSGLRARETVLALRGPAQPEIPLSVLEALDDADRIPYLVREMSLGTKRKVNAAQVQRWLADQPDAASYADLRAACGGDDAITARVLPYWGLLRPDLRGGPLVYAPGAVYVTQVGDRRAAGAHYTPKHLAEEIVKHTLDPLCHSPGPADGLGPDDEWRVRPADELLALRVADIAVGSGAFLVSACRYLAARLVEAWQRDGLPDDVPDGDTPDAQEERLLHARRLVTDRCLYGVDRDDMAVEMAKMSMWLVTLAKNRPFEFLDHAVRRGDSLLGITDLDQLLHLHLDPVQGKKIAGHVTFFEDTAGMMSSEVKDALGYRHELERIPVRDVRDADDKARLLAKADGHTEALRLIADGVVAAALARGRSATEYEQALATVRENTRGVLAGKAAATEQLRVQTRKWLEGGRPEGAPERECIHWPLEFPEVMENGGFSAIVGNPPFQGGQKITGSQGTDYRDHLVRWVGGGKRGSADLVAYFFLRAASVAPAGRAGLIATNTIGQGDSREVGLDQLTEAGWSIVRAVKSTPWPGEATLEVAKVWLGQRGESERVMLDDVTVPAITPALDAASRVTGTPHRLAANAGIAFQGSIVLGLGFTMTPDEAQELIDRDPRNAEVLFPYLNGEDLNNRPDASASRSVINFRDWPLERAEQYPDCMERVRRLVKPERDRNNRKVYRDYWWQYAEKRPAMLQALKGLDRVLAIARVSKVVLPLFVSPEQVVSEAAVVFATADAADLALLSSAPHYWWAIDRASTLETRIRYTPSDVFETLVRPESTGRMRVVGERLDSYRRGLMLDRNEGLTKTYNRVHNPGESAADIAELRAIHVEIDHAVAEAYGWQNLALDHDFHETRQGIRYTVGPTVRQEILDRLLELNFARFKEEEKRGLHNKGKPARGKPAKVPKPRAAADSEQLSMWG
ncbi:Eco57I restriction-modification methylase domain-containing protein [Micromonospora sp. NPDC002575]|uniref:Eco57I restriction-modification methylase domain-containing protein n=1 Tax=Micromonospora sp. NPDC002575 TaxID=3364222 RepID=UPI003685998C